MFKGFCPTSQSILKLNKKQIGFKIITWKFYFGGYQPAQKWLKDHKGRVINKKSLISQGLVSLHRVDLHHFYFDIRFFFWYLLLRYLLLFAATSTKAADRACFRRLSDVLYFLNNSKAVSLVGVMVDILNFVNQLVNHLLIFSIGIVLFKVVPRMLR